MYHIEVFPDTPLVDCLDILLHKGVSGLPVVERGTYKVRDLDIEILSYYK